MKIQINHRITWLVTSLALLISTSAYTSELSIDNVLKNVQTAETVPIRGLMYYEIDDKRFMVSADGRFVITDFEMLDLWEKNTIKTKEDIRKMHRVHPEKMPRLKMSDLSLVTFGSGSKKVTLFGTPDCQDCLNLATSIANATDYSLDYVFVGGPSDQNSFKKAAQIACLAKDSPSKALKLIREKNYAEAGAPCDAGQERVGRAAVVFKIFGGRQVPFLIAPNGEPVNGLPQNPMHFIENNS